LEEEKRIAHVYIFYGLSVRLNNIKQLPADRFISSDNKYKLHMSGSLTANVEY